jgi:hypothetical protein
MYAIDADRVIALEARVADLEARLTGVIRLVAASRPLERVLTSYGVSENQERVIYGIVNEMGHRLERGEIVPFTEFEDRITYLVAQLSGDRRFVELIVEALRIERPALTRLYEQFATAMALIRR